MLRSQWPILLIFACCGLSCTDEDRVTWVVPDQPRALILQNVDTVRHAAEAFAAANGGWMSMDAEADTTAEGLTLIDFLPGGERLLNPYTGERSEPQNLLAEAPGEVGYISEMINGSACAYVINAWDDTGEIALIDNIEALEAETISNAELVADLAQLWFGSGDGYAVYPPNVALFAGNLPDHQLLRNSFQFANTEPTDGFAAIPGQIGYIVVVDNQGWNIGFQISAFGRSSPIFETTEPYGDPQSRTFRSNCNNVLWAARYFAERNGGEYPLDVAVDTTPEGKRLVDYLIDGPLVNPWTGVAMQPINGRANNPGEIGYRPLMSGGIATQCQVSGNAVSGQFLWLPLP